MAPIPLPSMLEEWHVNLTEFLVYNQSFQNVFKLDGFIL